MTLQVHLGLLLDTIVGDFTAFMVHFALLISCSLTYTDTHTDRTIKTNTLAAPSPSHLFPEIYFSLKATDSKDSYSLNPYYMKNITLNF